MEPPVNNAEDRRMPAIDALRGLVMIIMALDHVRDMVSIPVPFSFQFAEGPASLFWTRWITHFCAPTFVMLAGIGAYLKGTKCATRGELSRFLLIRGLWLIVAELTIVNIGWTFHWGSKYTPFLQVIWVIGASMVALAGLVWIPARALAVGALLMIAGHNLLDRFEPTDRRAPIAPLWVLLHRSGMLDLGHGWMIFVVYPLIPWIGVMALGYAWGEHFRRDQEHRAKWLIRVGFVLLAFFVALRSLNGYGDANRWTWHSTPVATLIDFVDVTKYPPSLLFLLMTLGPTLLLLAGLDRARGRLVETLATYGRVPFFFYVAHLYLAHAMLFVVGTLQGFSLAELHTDFGSGLPNGFGLHLLGVYLVWMMVVLGLYPICRVFAKIKATRRDWWLSYL